MSLCRKCHNAIIYKQRNNQETFYCNGPYPGVKVPGDIVECNEFEDKKKPRISDYEKVAWVLMPNKSGKIGFQPPKKKKSDWED